MLNVAFDILFATESDQIPAINLTKTPRVIKTDRVFFLLKISLDDDGGKNPEQRECDAVNRTVLQNIKPLPAAVFGGD